MTVRVLILGCGSMAHGHAEAYAAMEGVRIVAGVDMFAEQLDSFCDRFDIPQRFTSLEQALLWGEFDAVSNVTPDGAHYATSMSCLAAGKHVLCEKPLSTDYARTLEMAAAAQQAGVVNMVNLTYRNVPALQKAAALVAAGRIGAIRHFQASYLQSWLTQGAWGDWRTEARWLWRLSTAHGSKGVLGDVGIHILDYATFIAGLAPTELSCRLQTFHKAPLDRIDEYPLDANDSVVMHLALDGGAIGTLTATRFASGHHNDLRLRLYGTDGGLEVCFEQGQSRLRGCLGPKAMEAARWRTIPCPEVPTNYARFIAAIQSGQPGQPDFARGAELQQMMDLAERSHALEARSLRLAATDPSAPTDLPPDLT